MPIAYALQAVLSSPAAQRVLLSFRPVDDRVWLGIQDYHKGASPAKTPYRDVASFRGLDGGMRTSFDGEVDMDHKYIKGSGT